MQGNGFVYNCVKLGFRLISLPGISRLICGHSTLILKKSSKIVDVAVLQTNLSFFGANGSLVPGFLCSRFFLFYSFALWGICHPAPN